MFAHQGSHPLAESDSDLDDVNAFEFFAKPLPKDDDDETFKDPNPPGPSGGSIPEENSKNKHLYPVSNKVEELRPEQIRWFYKATQDKKWTPFIGYDSLRLECKYREIQRQNTKGEKSAQERLCVRGSLYEVDVAEKKCYPIYWGVPECDEIMRGTWFTDSTWHPIEEPLSTEIEQEHLKAFQDMIIPTEAEEQKKLKQPVLLVVKFKDCYIEWNAINRVFMHYQSASSRLARIIGSKLGLSQGGTRLRRGYCYETQIYDKPADIGHLVFVVHGIGQKMDVGHIVSVCSEFREMSEKMRDRHCKNLDPDTDKRAEYLPVEWRSTLALDGDLVESLTPSHMLSVRNAVNSSVLDFLYYTSPLYRSEITEGLRNKLNRLYTMFCDRTPYFEPSGGKVSILAHSLGCIITYDIITGWNPIQLYDQDVAGLVKSEKSASIASLAKKSSELDDHGQHLLSQLDAARHNLASLENELYEIAQRQTDKSKSLKFKISNLFLIGSPLSVFLALRGIKPQGTGTCRHLISRSLCERVFNIYHPHDPVAYRLEPLILKHYSTIMPIKIYPQDFANKLPYDSLPAVAYNERKEVKKKDSKKSMEKNNNKSRKELEEMEKEQQESESWSKWFRRHTRDAGGKVSSELKELSERVETCTFSEDAKSSNSSLELSQPKIMMKGMTSDQTELEYRLDYCLHKGKISSAYWGMLTSHTAYWNNQDVALFLLQQLHPDYFYSQQTQAN